MNNYLNHITGASKKSLRFLFFMMILTYSSSAQTISNLDKFYSIIDTACTKLVYDLGGYKQVKLDLQLGTYYTVFANRIRGNLLRSGINFIPEIKDSLKGTSVDFIIDNCQVDYSQPEKDGLFGDYYTERTQKVSGSYFISALQNINRFIITEKDSVNVSEIEKIENRSYPFTHNEVPGEPFFSSIFEPFVAVGAAAITVILFFSVRSK